jgi:hypothetical protein
MRDAARVSVAHRSFDRSFLELWDMHESAVNPQAGTHLSQESHRAAGGR